MPTDVVPEAAGDDSLWPRYVDPDDLVTIESVPLTDRGLPLTTYDAVVCASRLWPDRVAVSAMPDAEHYRDVVSLTFAELEAEVHSIANALRARGVTRASTVAVLSLNWLRLDSVTRTMQTRLASLGNPEFQSDVVAALHDGQPRITVPRPLAGADELGTDLDRLGIDWDWS